MTTKLVLNNPFIEMDALHGPGHHPDHPQFPSEQYVFLFRNGYGASVIRSQWSYGGYDNHYEMACLTHDGNRNWNLYDGHVVGSLVGSMELVDAESHDVMGWLTVSDVKDLLRKIAELS